jgi:hypothetical protein
MPDYYIAAGVRRALVARELGWTEILARVIELGVSDRVMRIPLAALYSPKTHVPRDWRYFRVLRATSAGLVLDPIDVEPLGSPYQSSSIPLSMVSLR